MHRPEAVSTIEVGDVKVDPVRRVVTRDMQSIYVTRLECILLVCLLRQAGKCVPRKTLMENVWGSNHMIGAGALDVLVNSLRTKIDAPFGEKVICTVRGTGYVFRQVTDQEDFVLSSLPIRTRLTSLVLHHVCVGCIVTEHGQSLRC